MGEDRLPRGVIPPGTYAKGGRSPIAYVLLCAPCAGYAPITDEDYSGFLSGRCQGCGSGSRELHRFQSLIMSAANGGCLCTSSHPQVTGDLPTEESAGALWTEVKTRPPRIGLLALLGAVRCELSPEVMRKMDAEALATHLRDCHPDGGERGNGAGD